MAALDDLAQEASRGDARAMRALIEATSAPLYRLALRMTGDADDARDVLQEAYIRAHRALVEAKWKGDSKVETWLYRIVLNTALNHRRGTARRTRVAGVADGGGPAQVSPETEVDVARLKAAVLALPPDQRSALVLKELEGHTSAQIGQLLGCSEGAVEQRLARARAALRKRLGDG